MSEFLVLAGLALADSINPTTLGISLYLLMHRHYFKKLLLFICGVFTTYFVFGLVLELGFDKLLLNLWGEQHPALTALNLFIGVAIILYGFMLGKKPKKRRASLQKQSVISEHSAFALGSLATVMDLPTAFPYLGAISLIGTLSDNFGQAITILFAYNLIVISPLVLLLLIRLIFHNHSEAVIKKVRAKIYIWELPVLRFTLTIVGAIFIYNALASL